MSYQASAVYTGGASLGGYSGPSYMAPSASYSKKSSFYDNGNSYGGSSYGGDGSYGDKQYSGPSSYGSSSYSGSSYGGKPYSGLSKYGGSSAFDLLGSMYGRGATGDYNNNEDAKQYLDLVIRTLLSARWVNKPYGGDSYGGSSYGADPAYNEAKQFFKMLQSLAANIAYDGNKLTKFPFPLFFIS